MLKGRSDEACVASKASTSDDAFSVSRAAVVGVMNETSQSLAPASWLSPCFSTRTLAASLPRSSRSSSGEAEKSEKRIESEHSLKATNFLLLSERGKGEQFLAPLFPLKSEKKSFFFRSDVDDVPTTTTRVVVSSLFSFSK